MRRARGVSTAILTLCLPLPLSAQLGLSGQIDVVETHGYDVPLNQALRGDDPFNEVRVRLYGQHWVTDRVGIFTEFLFDLDAAVRVNGAYLVITGVGGKDWLDARIGMSPSSIGNFGMRSTYFGQNPLVGVPLIRQYRTTLDGGARATAAELVARKAANVRGMPVLYDSCWNLMWELFGSRGMWDYSLGATAGAVSNPLAALPAPGVQGLARVGLRPALGVAVGLSAAYGPYIGESRVPTDLAGPLTSDPAAYRQVLYGFDLEVVRGQFEVFAEGFVNHWPTPSIAEDLVATAGYLEVRRTIAPAWYVAARVDAMDFGSVPVAGGRADWDDDLRRVETALGYRLAREVLIRGGWQHTAFTQGPDPDQNVWLVQVSAVF